MNPVNRVLGDLNPLKVMLLAFVALGFIYGIDYGKHLGNLIEFTKNIGSK
jgi:hypothetical protein